MANITTSTTTSVEVSAVVAKATLELAQLRETARELEKKELALKAVILEAVGNADGATFGGLPIFNIQRSTRRSNDLKALAEKFPQAFAETLRETPQTKIITL
jgi:hypothetical protein